MDDIADFLCENDLAGRHDVTAAFHLNSGTGTDRVDNFRIIQQAATAIQRLVDARTAVKVPGVITGDILPMNTSAEGTVSYGLYGIDGACLRHGQFSKHTDVECAGLPAGMDIVRLYQDGDVTVRKVSRL